MKVRIVRWQSVCSWRWEVGDDDCGICRQPFDGCCVDCRVPGDDCPPVWGQCGHTFHMHCILKWLQSQQVDQPTCCMCRRPWIFRREESSEDQSQSSHQLNPS